VQLLRGGAPFELALHSASVPHIAAAFVKDTLDISATAKTHEIAAALVIGREDIIPDMFVSLVESLRSFSGVPFEQFIYYLNRHIQVDRDRHAPMARCLLEKLCSRDSRKIEEADGIACRVLQARISFWDSILSQLGD
jgi:pyrroloquinoline quinone (PQQ) biosynthesis protein C